MFSVFLRNPKIANPKRGFPYTARRFRRVTWQSRIFVFEPILKGWDLRGAPSGEGRMQSELLETTTNHACPTTSTTRTKKCTLAKQSTLSRVFYHECLKPPRERGRGRERGKGRTKGRGRGRSRGRLNCHLLACGSTRLYDAASVITQRRKGLWVCGPTMGLRDTKCRGESQLCFYLRHVTHLALPSTLDALWMCA